MNFSSSLDKIGLSSYNKIMKTNAKSSITYLPSSRPLRLRRAKNRNSHNQNEAHAKYRAKTKGWPPERRAAQALRIRAIQPWRHATGPKTREGKARSSQNAVRGGMRTAAMRRLKALMRLQRQSARYIDFYHIQRVRAARHGLPAPSLESLQLALQTIKRSAQMTRYNSPP